MTFEDVRSVHLIGAGGIGISAIGKFLLAQGKKVSGSDAKASSITDDLARRGVTFFVGHDGANVPSDCDLVVYTEAAPESNPERVVATERGIRQLGHFDFLGELSKSYRTICVTGTNGKSTTTAMVGRVFEEAGFDPTVFVGSLVPGWELGNLRMGKSDILIIEGDEYKQKMVKLWPETTVITNIEEDHLDVYRDLEHIVATFQELVDKTTGAVWINADDEHSMKLTGDRIDRYAVSYAGASLWAEDRLVEAGMQSFLVKRNVAGVDETLGRIELRVPGAFNMMNALAATAVATAYAVPFEKIQSALASFTGIWRRFERVGQIVLPPYQGGIEGGLADVISDYAHHPTAIRGTLAAAKEFFPGRRIVLLFEPHQHSRTKELFDEFVASFDDADVLVLSEIYGVVGRTDAADAVSSLDLLNAVEQRLPAGDPKVGPKFYTKNLDEAEAKLRELIESNDVVIVMGAGDVDQVARKLVT